MLQHWVACSQDGDCLEVISGCGMGMGDLLLLWMLAAGCLWACLFRNGGVADSGVVAVAQICFLI